MQAGWSLVHWDGCAARGQVIAIFAVRKYRRLLHRQCAELAQMRDQLAESVVHLVAQREQGRNRIRGVRPS